MSEEHAGHWITSGFKPRPWWRRVNVTIVALVIAIGAVAVIGWNSMTEARKNAPAVEQTAAAPRQKLKPRPFVGALVKRHRHQRAHSKKRASPPANAAERRSAR